MDKTGQTAAGFPSNRGIGMACGNHEVSASTVRLLGSLALGNAGGSHLEAYGRAVSHGLQGIAQATDQARRADVADRQRAHSRANVENAERAVAAATSRAAISSALRDAQRALNEARRTGGDRRARERDVRALEQRVDRLRDAAKARQSQIDHAETDKRLDRSSAAEPPDRLSRRSLGVPPARNASGATPRIAPATGTPEKQSVRDRLRHLSGHAARESAVDYSAIEHLDAAAAVATFRNSVVDQWVADYRQASGAQRDIREVTIGSYTYVYDAGGTGAPAERLIGVYGVATPPDAAADRRYMAGFPDVKRSHTQDVEKGHVIAHSIGGTEMGINLAPQSRLLNRGKGSEWREQEIYCQKNPGTFLFVKFEYSDASDEPRTACIGVLKPSGLDARTLQNELD